MLVLLTAITVVLATKVVGIMLVSALLILPAATSLQIARGFRGAMLISTISAVSSVLVGTTTSVLLNLPAGATIVMCGLLIFAIALTVRYLRR